MTIEDILYVLNNQSKIVVHNDAIMDDDFEGDPDDFAIECPIYDDICYEEVTDLYADSKGVLHICYSNDEYENEDEEF